MLGDLQKLIRLVEKEGYLKEVTRCQTMAEISHRGTKYPILAFSLGTENPSAPVLFLTGGIHGLERIGAQLAWSLLKTTIDRLVWDKSLRELFRHVRLVVAPLLNPVGYYHFTRSNGQGVDLMRNSTIDSLERTPFLLGGHRLNSALPWYRGTPGVLEIENQALTRLFANEAQKSTCVLAVDFHSGFGLRDRLWFPFSYTRTPFDHLAEVHALTQLFEQTHPYHIYQVEPQSQAYLLNGDIWDQLYLEYCAANELGVFIPFTLEMGSWSWVKKNPLQLFSRQGVFNPIKEHRVKRTYRRHHLLFDFLLRAVYSNEVWSVLDQGIRAKHEALGLSRWYQT